MVAIGVIIAIHARNAQAVCGTGGRKLVGHLNDVFFDATISAMQERNIQGKIVNTGYGPNGEAWIACDIWARTSVPGLYIENAYGSGSYAPPNTWASVAQSGGTADDFGAEVSFGSSLHNGFRIHYFGPHTPGYVGRIEIAVDGNDIGYGTYNLGYINVYLDSPQSPQPDTWFVIRATAGNISGNKLTIDHGRINNDPKAVLLAFPTLAPATGPKGISDNHPYAVRYDGASGRWQIEHTDGASMVVNTAFNVRIDPSGIRATRSGAAGPTITISNPVSDLNKYGVVMISPVDVTGAVDPHPVMTQFNASLQKWEIRNADGANIPLNASFNVRVLGYAYYVSDVGGVSFGSLSTNGLGVDLGGRPGGFGSPRSIGSTRILPSFVWMDTAQAAIIVTQNANPVDMVPIMANPNYTSLDFTSPTWKVVNQSGAGMRCRRAFNIWSQREDDPQYPPPVLP